MTDINKMTGNPPITKPRATPVPQGYDRILAKALKLVLQDRVSMMKALVNGSA